MTTTTRRRHSDGGWLWYLLCGVAAALVYFLLPSTEEWISVRVPLYSVITVSGAVAIFIGLARNRPSARLPWLLIGASQLCYSVGDIAYYVGQVLLGHPETFPALNDFLYLAHFPIMLSGLVMLIRHRTPGRDLPSVLDASVLVAVASMLSWIYVVKPWLHTDHPPLITLISLLYPVLDLAWLAVALRLLLTPGRRQMAFWALGCNLLAVLVADSIYAYQRVEHIYQPGSAVDFVWLLGVVAIGVAGLHPTMATLDEPAAPRVRQLGPTRLVSLVFAALVAPGTLLIQDVRGSLRDVPVIAAACAVLALLTIARLVVVVSQQRQLAVTDSLTGLHTRRYFESRLPVEAARSARTGQSLGLFLIDIDHFKSINDVYGHLAGDQVLMEVAARLRRATRGGDVLARYGGEEFVSLVRDVSPDGVHAIGERLRRAVSRGPVRVSSQYWVSVTVSVGAASHPDHVDTPDELVAAADSALYSAKTQGRDRIALGGAEEAATTHSLGYLYLLADEIDRRVPGYPANVDVALWARLLSLHMHGTDEQSRRAELAARLRAIGRMPLPAEVLAATRAPDTSEQRLLDRQAANAAMLLRPVSGLTDIAEIVGQQREWFDGSGQPEGLRGDEIRLETRIIVVCDTWATLSATGPSTQQNIEALRGESGTRFDPAAVDALLDLHAAGRIVALPERMPSER